MAFEFVMVHSGLFMTFMPKRISALVFVPFYGLFALGFNSFTQDNTILILYCVVVFNRMRFAFSDADDTAKSKAMLRSIFSLLCYFVLIFVVLIFQSLIPKLGLTEDYLIQSNYHSHINGSGEFVEKPYIPLCLGTIYYIALTIVEAYFVSITSFDEDYIDEYTLPHKEIKTRFNKTFKNKTRNRQ